MTVATPPTTFVGLFEELKTDALNAWQAAKNTAVALEHSIVPVVEQDLMVVLGQVKTVAINMVMTLATSAFSNLSGGQKNTITTQAIVQAAAAQGKTIALQDAQMLAQQAFNALRTTLAPGS